MNLPPIFIQGRGYIPFTLEFAAAHRNVEITYFYFDAYDPSDIPNSTNVNEDFYAEWAGKSSVTIGNDLVIGCANCTTCGGEQEIIENYFDWNNNVLETGDYYFIPSIGDDGVEIDLRIIEPIQNGPYRGHRQLGHCNGTLWLIVSSPDPNDLPFHN